MANHTVTFAPAQSGTLRGTPIVSIVVTVANVTTQGDAIRAALAFLNEGAHEKIMPTYV